MTLIPEVRAALARAFDAATGTTLAGVQVVRGPAKSVSVRDDKMLTFEGVTWTRNAGSRTSRRKLPGQTVEEDFTVNLLIIVSLSGTAAQWDADDTALNIFEAVAAIVDALSVTGVAELTFTGDGTLEPESDNNGRYAAVACGVQVLARA